MKRPNYKLYIMRKFEKLQSIKLKHNNVFDRIEIDYKLNRGGGGNEEDDEIGVVWYKKNGEPKEASEQVFDKEDGHSSKGSMSWA